MSATRTQPRAKHLPQRTCVACGSTNAKRELVRLVRTPDGAVEPDVTGKAPGRGAYLCRTADCWQKALKRGRLEHALRVKLTASSRAALVNAGTELVGRNA
jgi:predicted RNA-binding protein YlxR (DUF448 family)